MTPKAVENHIRKRYVDRLFDVACLARELKISESYLREVVNGFYKCSPHCLIETIRLEDAVQLLCDERMRIYSVCPKVGYANVKTFRTAFKKRIGMTPEKWRVMLKRSADVQSEIDRMIKDLWDFRNM